MKIIEIIKAIVLGIVEGLTEWLPISSTGHMILVDEFLKLRVSPEFLEMFLVVIQFGAIMAVIVVFWKRIFPFSFKDGFKVKPKIVKLWTKIIVAVLPSAIIGFLFDDKFNALFYNYVSVAIALIVFGVLFILVENYNKDKAPTITRTGDITYKTALIIGLFQVIAAIFPGTSRSGATIIGALLLGVARTTAAEFTFYLAIPTMLGASLLKLAKFGLHFTGLEFGILFTGTVVAFLVSIVTIKFLMDYVKKNDFKFFGWYRIALGCIVLIYFIIAH